MPDYERPMRNTRWGPVPGARCYAVGWGETLSKYRAASIPRMFE